MVHLRSTFTGLAPLLIFFVCIIHLVVAHGHVHFQSLVKLDEQMGSLTTAGLALKLAPLGCSVFNCFFKAAFFSAVIFFVQFYKAALRAHFLHARVK